MSGVRRILIVISAIVSCSCAAEGAGLIEVSRKTAGADLLTIFKPAQSSEVEAAFCIAAPDPNDTQVNLSVAAAFTTRSSSISGIAICNGKKVAGPVSSHLSGTVLMIGGDFQIFSSQHGKRLTPEFLRAVENSGGSLFQQFMLVNDGTAQTFKDSARAPRRALVVFNDGSRAVVQKLEALTMAQFARDLKIVGVRNAIYMPVGDGDGGWYRSKGKIVSIGKSSSPVPVQSNWVVWKERQDGKAKPGQSELDLWLDRHRHWTD